LEKHLAAMEIRLTNVNLLISRVRGGRERANGPAFSPNKIGGRQIDGRRIRLFGAPSRSERPEVERVVPRGDVGQLQWTGAEKPAIRRDMEVQAVMAELVALRTILLNVLYKQANGESLTAGGNAKAH